MPRWDCGSFAGSDVFGLAGLRLPLWGSAAGGVGVSEFGCPLDIAAGEWSVGPAGLVADAVVVSAEGGEIADLSRAALRPGDLVVEITGAGGHATPGKHTTRMEGFDMTLLAGSRSTSRQSLVNRHSGGRVGDHIPPLGSVLLFGDLTGNVRDDRPIPG